MKVRKRCHNCIHHGTPFKISKVTHYHCEHPYWTSQPEKYLTGEFSPWDTLVEFWNTCEKHELKEN